MEFTPFATADELALLIAALDRHPFGAVIVIVIVFCWLRWTPARSTAKTSVQCGYAGA